MGRDNISGSTSRGFIGGLFLMPGRVFQWLLYLGWQDHLL